MKKGLVAFTLLLTIFFIGCGNKNDKNSVEASGTIEATTVALSAQVSGKIKELKITDGTSVKANDTLLVIDREQYELQVQRAEAIYQSAQAQLELLLNGARIEDINSVNENSKQAQINFTQAETDFNRAENLFKVGSISKKQYEDAQNKLNIAKATLAASTEALKKVKNLARPEELKQAQAKVSEAKANFEIAKSNLAYCTVIAPTKGIVVKKFIEVGETVSALSSLLKITDLNVVKLVIYIPETELGKVKVGQEADITIDSYKDKVFKGKVVYISPESEFTPKNIQTKDERTKLVYAVKIEVDNKELSLKDGMPADAKIHVN